MQSSLGRVLRMCVVVVLFVFSACADTLEMKDGRVIQGKYMGGTRLNIRFLVDGQVQLYPVADVLALTFGTTTGAAAAPARQPAPPPAVTGSRSSPDEVTVPAGTRLLVRMIDSVDSDTNKVGDRFRASLETDLAVDGTVAAPKGADVYGRLVEAKEAGRIAGKSQLKLELTDIRIAQRLQPIVTGDYEVSGESRGADTAKKAGVGAAIGAAIGAIAGGGKGAAIGAGVGAGAGTAVQVLTKGEQVRVPSETLLEFTIQQPFSVRVSRSTAR